MSHLAKKLPSPAAIPAIGDYAIIGDGRAAALIAKNGAIEWLCWPRFDSSSIFGVLLDRKRGGAFAVQPSAPFEVRRRYLPDTNVLETTFETADGCARLTDLMPIFTDEDHRERLAPTRCVLRLLECISGKWPLTLPTCRASTMDECGRGWSSVEKPASTSPTALWRCCCRRPPRLDV